MIGLDCHVIVAHDTPHAWVRECIESINVAVACAGFDVQVYMAPYVDGHVGLARAGGYALGSHPYVTCVDDDDYVLPHAFSQMKDALASNATAVCTPEQTLQNGHFRRGAKRHHLIAYRRARIIDHTQWPCCGDVAQMRALGPHVIDLPTPAYVHRLYMQSKARVLRRTRLDELERARA